MENCEIFCNAVAASKIGYEGNILQVKCPDQHVGNIYNLGTSNEDFPTRINSEVAYTVKNKILLILESPHKKEFVGMSGPAKGKTGALIRKHILEIIGNKIDEYSELFLVNAVQYQCSLGHSPNLYRDKVFRSSWASFGKREFSNRLKLLSNGMPTLIINACTTGKKIVGTPTLQGIVENAINETLGRHCDFLLSHPSSWWAKQNRKPKLFSKL